MGLAYKELLLLGAFNSLPQHSESLSRFEKSYLYRSQFPFLGESGNETDSSGLIYAVSKALSLSVGFGLERSTIYIDSGMGIETVPSELLTDLKPLENFREKLSETVHRLSSYTIAGFFQSLDWIKLDYLDQAKLQQAVEESLLNYARIATLGISGEEKSMKKPLSSHFRLKTGKEISNSDGSDPHDLGLRSFDFQGEDLNVDLALDRRYKII